MPCLHQAPSIWAAWIPNRLSRQELMVLVYTILGVLTPKTAECGRRGAAHQPGVSSSNTHILHPALGSATVPLGSVPPAVGGAVSLCPSKGKRHHTCLTSFFPYRVCARARVRTVWFRWLRLSPQTETTLCPSPTTPPHRWQAGPGVWRTASQAGPPSSPPPGSTACSSNRSPDCVVWHSQAALLAASSACMGRGQQLGVS